MSYFSDQDTADAGFDYIVVEYTIDGNELRESKRIASFDEAQKIRASLDDLGYGAPTLVFYGGPDVD